MNSSDLHILLNSAGLSFLGGERGPVFAFDWSTSALLAANPPALALYGISAEEFSRLSASDLCPPEDVPAWHGHLAFGESTTHSARAVRQCKQSGEILYANIRFFRSGNAGSRVVAAVVEDVTAAKLAEIALVRREARYRSLAARSRNLQFVAGEDGVIRFANPAAEDFLGRLHGQAAGGNFLDFVSPESVDAFKAALAARESRGPLTLRLKRADASRADCKLFLTWIPGGVDGRAFVIEAFDVTETARDEDGLRLAAEALRKLNSGVTIWEADNWAEPRLARLVMANDAAERFTGIPLQSRIGKTLEETLPRLLRTDVPGKITQAACFGHPADLGELHCDEAKPFGVYSIKVFRLSGAMLGVVFDDASEKRRMETKARKAEAMELVAQVAAGVAHNFNNILTVVELHAGLLSKELPKASDGHAEKITAAIRRASTITSQLLAFATQQSLKSESLDINAVARHAAGQIEPALAAGVSLELSLAPDLPPIAGDKLMLELAILNVLKNGRDFIKAAGRLELRTEMRETGQADVVAHPEARAGSFVRISIADTGSGIGPEVLPYIFNPFFTTKDVGEGAGLGLATAYGIVKQHGGWIHVVTEPGKGSEFQIFLPHGAKADTLAAERKSDKMTVHRKETILLVEDELEVRLVLSKILQTQGYFVLDAATGVEALAVWKENRDRIDLLLTDIIMPGGVTGWELADKLRADKPLLKVVFTSGYSKDAMRADTSQPKGSILLQKPYSPDTLLQTVANALDGNGEVPVQHSFV